MFGYRTFPECHQIAQDQFWQFINKKKSWDRFTPQAIIKIEWERRAEKIKKYRNLHKSNKSGKMAPSQGRIIPPFPSFRGL
jgi:hypothetical protein